MLSNKSLVDCYSKILFSLEINKKTYGQRTIFENFHLQINQGESIVLFGANGSGKSTLLNLVAGIDKEYQGQILFHSKEKENNFSIVMQDPGLSLFPWWTNRRNVCLKKGDIDLSHIKKLIPSNINFDDYPFRLSGGQRQLLALMQAFHRQSNLLLLDEPFSAMDIETKLNSIKALRHYQRQYLRSLILVTHDLDTALMCADKIIVLNSKPGHATKIFTTVVIPSHNHKDEKFLISNNVMECRNECLRAFYEV